MLSEIIKTLPLGPGVTLLQSDANGLVAFDKPAGVRSHPNDERADANALLLADYDSKAEAYHWRDSEGGARQLFLINRIDAPTSGLILATLNPDCAEAVRLAFRSRAVEKTYLARVFNRPRPASGRWDDRMQTQHGRDGLRSRLGVGPLAHSRYRTVSFETSNQIVTSVLELSPETGRTHQLRVQCQGHGVPIVGDQTYGDFNLNRKFFAGSGLSPRLCLHAWRMRLSYQLAAKTYTFSAEAPIPVELTVSAAVAPANKSPIKTPGILNTRRFKRP